MDKLNLNALTTTTERIGMWCYGFIPDPDLCEECGRCSIQKILQQLQPSPQQERREDAVHQQVQHPQ